jgi:septal ring factor EnvC (AmiA/AmiB activator)
MRFVRALVTLAVLAAAALPVVAPSQAHAQASTEDRLRDALRKTTADLRAAQDAQAAVQLQLDQTTKQRDALTAQIAELDAKLAAQPAPAPAPAAPAAPAPDRSQEVRALQGQVQSLQAAIGKYQASYNDAVGLARGKDAQSRQAEQAAKSASEAAQACTEENAKLMGVADDILHLYTTAGFKTTVLGSYEPLLGLKRVELQNIVQDYEGRIRDHQYRPKPPEPTQ